MKLQPQDLRIGNLVNYNGMDLPVFGIASPKPLKDKRYADKWIIELFDGASTIDCIIDDIQPIPLTEETLINHIDWQFEKGFNLSYLNTEFGERIEFLMENIIDGTSNFKIVIHKSTTWQGDYLEPIQYFVDNKHLEFAIDDTIHKLQNLFYIVSGQELPIKNTTNYPNN